MDTEKRYQIFISSTFSDLEQERRLVMEAILSLNCFPAGMEMFPATDMEQFDYIKGIIDNSDYYILILAGRYGSLADDGVSFTEKEYRYAKKQGIPILAFIRKNIELLPSKYVDQNLEKIERFRQEVMCGRLVLFWDSPAELPFLISKSLMQVFKSHPRKGWIRAENLPLTDAPCRDGSNQEGTFNYSKKNILFNDFLKTLYAKKLLFRDDILPIGYNMSAKEIYSIDLKKAHCYAVSGKQRTGKTNALKVMIKTACEKKDKVYIIELSDRKELEDTFLSESVTIIHTADEILYVFSQLFQVYLEREELVKEYISKGLTDEEIFLMIQKFKRIHIFIDDLILFIKELKKSDKYDYLYGHLAYFIPLWHLKNLYYYYAIDQSKAKTLQGDLLYEEFINNSHGIHFGGEFWEERILNFEKVGYRYAEKKVKPGIGYVKEDDKDSASIFEENRESFILLPLYK